MYRIGIDLGGTNTAAGLVDTNGQIVDRETVKTNIPTDLSRIVDNIFPCLDSCILIGSGLVFC